MEIKLDHERARELQRHQGDVVEIRRRARQWRLTDCDVTALTRMRRALMQEMEQQEARLNEADDRFLMFVENGRPLQTEEVRQRIESLSNEWESMNSHLKQVDDAILERQLRQRMVRLMGSELGANLWEAIVFILILFIVVLTIVELLVPLSVDTIRWILTIDTIGCFLLLGDFFLRLSLSDDKRWYFRRYWIDFVASIPFAPALHLGRIVRITRFARILRLLRLGRALRVLLFAFRGLDTLTRTFQLNLLKRSVITAALLLFFGALSIQAIEGVQEVSLQDIDESLWWSFTTMVTGGFADLHNPTTSTGRLVTVGLVLLGLTVTGVFTASLTSVLVEDESSRLEQIHRRRLRTELAPVHQKLDLLSGDMNEGLIALETVSQALSNQKTAVAVANTLTKTMIADFECLQASVHLLNTDQTELVRFAMEGNETVAPDEQIYLDEAGLIGRVMSDLLAQPDIGMIDLEPETTPCVQVNGVAMVCPLVAAKRPLGVLHVVLPEELGQLYLYNRVPMTLAHHAAMAFYMAGESMDNE